MLSQSTSPATLPRPNSKYPCTDHVSESGPQLDDLLAGPVGIDHAELTERARRLASGYDWPTVLWIGALHVLAVVGLFFFSWQGLVAAIVLHWMTGGLGICLGYHRLFTHRSFTAVRPVRWIIATLGTLAGEGPIISWVATHRQHHAHSDTEHDPHSPRDGGWWSHILWVFYGMGIKQVDSYCRRWSPDLLRERYMCFLQRTFILWHFALGAVLLAAGWWWGGPALGVSLLLWGMFVRLVLVMHATWLVNSATHIWGYRNYKTTDDSKNLWWVALLSYGEGWHNNHHAHPHMARAGHKWWEFDITFATIRLLEKVGLVTDIVDYKRKSAA